MRPPVRSGSGDRQGDLPGEPADGGQDPGHGGVGHQTLPVAPGQGVVRQRDHGVGDQGRQPAAPGAPPPGRPVGAQRADDQRAEHHHVLEGADRTEQDGRQQAEQGQRRAARRGHAQPGRLPGRPPGAPQTPDQPTDSVRQLRHRRASGGRAGYASPNMSTTSRTAPTRADCCHLDRSAGRDAWPLPSGPGPTTGTGSVGVRGPGPVGSAPHAPVPGQGRDTPPCGRPPRGRRRPGPAE